MDIPQGINLGELGRALETIYDDLLAIALLAEVGTTRTSSPSEEEVASLSRTIMRLAGSSLKAIRMDILQQQHG